MTTVQRYLSGIPALLLLALVFVATFAGVAHAAAAADGTESGLVDLAKPVLDALLGGKPGLAAALALVLLAGAAGRYAGAKWAWFNSSAGRASIVLVGSFGGAAAVAIGGGAAWSLGLAWKALGVAASAAGGYSLLKALIVEPLLRPLIGKAPGWLQPILGMLLSLFAPPDPIAKAEIEGDKAVAAKPSPGAAGVIGNAQEID